MRKKTGKVLRIGFSLVEVIIGTIIIAIMSLLFASILFNLLKGSIKADANREVKQTGDYALSIMETKIRNAQKLDNTVVTCDQDGEDNSTIKVENFDGSSYQYETDFMADRIRETYSPLALPSQVSYLTSDKVKVSTPLTFNCKLNLGGRSLITVSFGLNYKNAVTEEFGQSSFRSSIYLRNFNE